MLSAIVNKFSMLFDGKNIFCELCKLVSPYLAVFLMFRSYSVHWKMMFVTSYMNFKESYRDRANNTC